MDKSDTVRTTDVQSIFRVLEDSEHLSALAQSSDWKLTGDTYSKTGEVFRAKICALTFSNFSCSIHFIRRRHYSRETVQN